MVRWLYTITVTGELVAGQTVPYRCVAQFLYFIDINVCVS